MFSISAAVAPVLCRLLTKAEVKICRVLLFEPDLVAILVVRFVSSRSKLCGTAAIRASGRARISEDFPATLDNNDSTSTSSAPVSILSLRLAAIIASKAPSNTNGITVSRSLATLMAALRAPCLISVTKAEFKPESVRAIPKLLTTVERASSSVGVLLSLLSPAQDQMIVSVSRKPRILSGNFI